MLGYRWIHVVLVTQRIRKKHYVTKFTAELWSE